MLQCPEMVAPFGSYEAIFGTNPIAISIPTAAGEGPLVLDMATSAAAYFSLVAAARDNGTIPGDIAYDEEGRETTDPTAAMRGALRVFDRDHKGSNLALMVELLAGAMTGASMTSKHSSGNWGSLVIAIDPTLFGSFADFHTAVSEMTGRVKHAKRLGGVEEIFLPGERSDRIEKTNLANGFLRIPAGNLQSLRKLAA